MMNKKHKWRYYENGHGAKCEKCMVERRFVINEKGGYDDIIFFEDGTYFNVKGKTRMPPCNCKGEVV